MFRNIFKERQRSRAVLGLGVLDTPAEPAFDRFVQQAASAFDAPIALLSMIHGDDQWFKATHGIALSCIARSDGFCGFALDQGDVLEACTPELDPRFAELPVVKGEPWIRYYIGAPLRLMNGMDVGALCVLDTQRRPAASADQHAYLRGIARQAALALEMRVVVNGRSAAA